MTARSDNATFERNAAAVAMLRRRYRTLVKAHPRGAISETEYLARNLPPMLGPHGVRYRNPRAARISRANPGRGKRSRQFDRCVAEVTAKGRGTVNPYAVCQAATRKRRKNPRKRRKVYRLLAIKGKDRLYYVGGNKFAKHGRPVTFASEEAARATGRELEAQFPILKRYSVRVDRA